MFAVCVTLRLNPGAQDAFLPLIAANAQASLRLEPDCHRFDVATDSADSQLVFLYELYTDSDGFAAHLESDHFKSFDQASATMIAEKHVQTFDRVQT